MYRNWIIALRDGNHRLLDIAKSHISRPSYKTTPRRPLAQITFFIDICTRFKKLAQPLFHGQGDVYRVPIMEHLLTKTVYPSPQKGQLRSCSCSFIRCTQKKLKT